MGEFSVQDRVVVVTGAGQGLGRCFAEHFARAGGKVVVAELNEERADAVAREICAAGGTAISVVTDVTSANSVSAMVEDAMFAFGRIDVLVNNAAMAGVLGQQPFTEIPENEWDAVIDVNVKGAFLCSRAVVPHMIKAKWGRIINLSSTTTMMGRVNMLHYVTSKAAITGMTRSLARELGASGITVNAIYPGLTLHDALPELSPERIEKVKNMQCIPRLETPEDLVGAMLFLGSEASCFMTGQSLVIDGGAVHA